MTVPGTWYLLLLALGPYLLVTGIYYAVPGTCAATSYLYEGLQYTEIRFYRDPRDLGAYTICMYYW